MAIRFQYQGKVEPLLPLPIPYLDAWRGTAPEILRLAPSLSRAILAGSLFFAPLPLVPAIVSVPQHQPSRTLLTNPHGGMSAPVFVPLPVFPDATVFQPSRIVRQPWIESYAFVSVVVVIPPGPLVITQAVMLGDPYVSVSAGGDIVGVTVSAGSG